MKRWILYVALIAILIIGGLIRFQNLTVWPREGATFDEFAWTFQGLSIWEKGIPTSWSPHKAYTNKVEYFNPQGAHFTLVTPYLEHPPLFGLVAGGFAYIRGIRSFDEVTIAKIRPLALFMGVVSIYAVFLLASAVCGSSIGLIASGLYAIIPTIVVGSRIVQNENFFIPFFLFALYFAYKYLETPKTKNGKVQTTYFVFTSLLCGLLPLAKIPWIAASLSVIGMFLFSKKWNAAFWVFAATMIGLSGWLLYGYMTDAELFANLWKLQLARYDMTFDSFFVLFRDPVVVDRFLVDGWIYFGWIAMFVLMMKDTKKHLPIIFGFLAYLAVFVFAIPGEPLHGWYRYPFYPFLTIAIAVFLKEYFNKRYFVTAIFFILTGFSMLAGSWERVLGFSYPVLRIYLFAVAIGALPGIFPKLEKNKFFRWINIALLVFVIFLSIWTVLGYNEQ
jgi:4-amino-4-deoxy-L-arabinose transferase-like glycosyltransferase